MNILKYFDLFDDSITLKKAVNIFEFQFRYVVVLFIYKVKLGST